MCVYLFAPSRGQPLCFSLCIQLMIYLPLPICSVSQSVFRGTPGFHENSPSVSQKKKCGRVLTRFLELRNDVGGFFLEHNLNDKERL